MAQLMVSISGVRGIVGEGLTPQVAINFAQAFGSFLGNGKVIVGRDSRVTGEMMKNAVFSGLLAVGSDIVDIGVCSTPTVQMAVEHFQAHGGIAITASHNPIEWNALKLIDSTGMFLDEQQGQEVKNIVDEKAFTFVSWEKIGKIETYNNASEDHLDAIMKLEYIDSEKIRARNFKVVVDCVNGAGETIVPKLLDKLGCQAIYINREANGLFPRSPEPVPENLKELSKKVISEKADIGFAVDPDVDRLAIVSEKGKPLGEEYTLAMAVNLIAQRKRGPIVVNASVTRAIDDLADKYHSEVVRTKVGEIHVAKKMKELDAAIGGEGNGGVILPELHLGRDAPLAIALTLQQLADFDGSISMLHRMLPQYFQAKKKLELVDIAPSTMIDKLIKQHEKEKIDLTDGIKINWKKEWVHIRASNTEPIIRVLAEAKTEERAEALCYKFIKQIESA